MSDLAAKQCVPCKGGVALLVLQHRLGPDGNGWHIEREHHHPDIFLAWGRVRITIWTHKIDGLTECDFVFAANCDQLA